MNSADRPQAHTGAIAQHGNNLADLLVGHPKPAACATPWKIW
jgi:hypothetical protein